MSAATPAWEYHVCGPQELAEVVDLVNGAYRGRHGVTGWTHELDIVRGERTTLEDLRRELAAAPSARILMLKEAGAPLACLRLELQLEPGDGPACFIGMLAVEPALQARGAGRALLEHAEREGLRLGARVARLTVVSIRTGLLEWYQRRGYRLTGKTEPFPYDERFGTPLRGDLEFVVLEKRLQPDGG